VNTDLLQLVAAAADLCRKGLRHAVLEAEASSEGGLAAGDGRESEDCESDSLDRCLRLQVRNPEGVRLLEEDLELELYRSGDDLHLTLAWAAFEERPMLWQGRHPVWMDGASGARCERPEQGLPLEALARRLRALLVGAS
jgi:hypothetical protein